MTTYTLEFEFSHQPTQIALDVAVSQFICCVYEQASWISVVCEVDQENEDVLVKFLHPRFHHPRTIDPLEMICAGFQMSIYCVVYQLQLLQLSSQKLIFLKFYFNLCSK